MYSASAFCGRTIHLAVSGYCKKTMTQNLLKILGLIFIIQFISCTNPMKKENNNEKDFKRDSFADSLWIKYATAMETKNLDFLEKNSFDTIQCVDCIFDNKSENEYYDSKMIFVDYLDKLMHLDSLTNREFSTFRNDTIIRISYSIKWKLAPEGAYGLVFTFKKGNDKFLFNGMFTIP
jgi:hypothetical protein